VESTALLSELRYFHVDVSGSDPSRRSAESGIVSFEAPPTCRVYRVPGDPLDDLSVFGREPASVLLVQVLNRQIRVVDVLRDQLT